MAFFKSTLFGAILAFAPARLNAAISLRAPRPAAGLSTQAPMAALSFFQQNPVVLNGLLGPGASLTQTSSLADLLTQANPLPSRPPLELAELSGSPELQAEQIRRHIQADTDYLLRQLPLDGPVPEPLIQELRKKYQFPILLEQNQREALASLFPPTDRPAIQAEKIGERVRTAVAKVSESWRKSELSPSPAPRKSEAAFASAPMRIAPPIQTGLRPARRTGFIDTTPSKAKDIDDIRYKDIVRRMKKIAKGHGSVEMLPIGESAGLILRQSEWMFYSRLVKETAPKKIYALDIHPSGEKKGLIVITAGHHATESAGPMAALDFAEKLLASEAPMAQFLKRHYQLTVIPVVDADTFALPFDKRMYSLRSNNFYHKLEETGPEWRIDDSGWRALRAGPESRHLAEAVRTRAHGTHLALAFDLHESAWPGQRPGGFYIEVPGDFQEDHLLKAAAKNLKNKGLPLANDHRWKKESGQPQMFHNIPQALGAASFTLESPRWKPDGRTILKPATRIEMHLAALEGIISGYFRNSDSAPGPETAKGSLNGAPGSR